MNWDNELVGDCTISKVVPAPVTPDTVFIADVLDPAFVALSTSARFDRPVLDRARFKKEGDSWKSWIGIAFASSISNRKNELVLVERRSRPDAAEKVEEVVEADPWDQDDNEQEANDEDEFDPGVDGGWVSRSDCVEQIDDEDDWTADRVDLFKKDVSIVRWTKMAAKYEQRPSRANRVNEKQDNQDTNERKRENEGEDWENEREWKLKMIATACNERCIINSD